MGVILLVLVLSATPVAAQIWNPGQNNNFNTVPTTTSTSIFTNNINVESTPKPSTPVSDDNNNNYNNPASSLPNSGRETSLPFFANSSFISRRQILMAHAIMACLTWAFLIPIGGLILRLNIDSPWILRLHVILQISSAIIYSIAAGLGIFLILSLDQFSQFIWNDIHPKIGLVILGLTIAQPIAGYMHHRLFKRRMFSPVVDSPGDPPKRTTNWGHIHLWLGRSLIVLGIVNGGLGIRLANHNNSNQTTAIGRGPDSTAKIGYIAGTAAGMTIYIATVAVFEWRKARQRRRTSSTSATQTPAESSDELPFASWRKYPHF